MNARKQNPPNSGKSHFSDSALLNRIIAPFLLAVLTIFFFKDILNPSVVARHWLWEDFLFQNFPYRFFAATSLARGEFPFWNPYVFGGMPFFADVQTAVLYPFNLVQALFAGPNHLSSYLVEFFVILQIFLGGYFTYRFLRSTDIDKTGSLIGALGFAFSGFMITHVIHTNFISVIIWFPLMLEMLEKALASGRWRYAACCAGIYAVSTLGGYPQYSLYIGYFLGLYWLHFELSEGFKGFDRQRLITAVVRLSMLLFIGIAGVGFNAFNYLPAAELAQYTPRSIMTYQNSIEHSFAPWLLLKLIDPYFFGTQYPSGNTYWAGGYSAFWETCLFTGVLSISLAAWGGIRRVKTNRHARFALVMAAVALWLALGGYGGLYKLAFHLLPGFDKFRIPGRFNVFTTLALAILAAHGWQAIKDDRREKIASKVWPAVIPLAILILTLALYVLLVVIRVDFGLTVVTRARSIIATSLVGSVLWALAAAVVLFFAPRIKESNAAIVSVSVVLIAFAELAAFGMPFLKGTVSPEQMYAESGLVKRFKQESEHEHFRVNARSFEHPGIMLLRRNEGSINRVELIEGYNPLQLKRRLNELDVPRRLDLLNVKYAIRVDAAQNRAGFSVNDNMLPRAWIAERWRIIEDGDKILKTLNSADFDYHHEVILEKVPDGLEISPDGGAGENIVEILEYKPNAITLKASCRTDCILVLSEWDYPAWKAEIDGAPVEILRANHAQRAIALTQGNHDIKMCYGSDSFHRGLIISLAVFLAGLVLSLISVKLKKW